MAPGAHLERGNRGRGVALSKPARGALIAGFATLYFVWGSTYLAIRIAVASLPPFLISGARFFVAGAALLAWTRLRGMPLPSRREWFGAASVGICLCVLSNVPVVWAEQRIPSGVVALFAAGTPLLIALFNGRRTATPLGRRRMVGLVLGTLGLAALGSAMWQVVHDVTPLAVLGLASFSWAVGSTYGRDWGQPRDLLVASAAQMLTGGAAAVLISALSGEWARLDPGSVSWQSLAAWGYLALVGSLVAYPVYQWLLGVADATAVASYTYVNPIVALVLGAALAHEEISGRTFLAVALLIPAVGLVVSSEGRRELEVPQEE